MERNKKQNTKETNLPSYYVTMLVFTLLLVACEEKPIVEKAKISDEPSEFAAYNHTALVVNNLDTSLVFYQQLFQFDTLPFPFPPREGIKAKWLKIGENAELHIAELAGKPSNSSNPGHMGFMVSSMDTLLDRLMEVSSAYKNGLEKLPTLDTMPYGARTTMIYDPDGYQIHIIESPK